MAITIGNWVYYRLTQADADMINGRRVLAESNKDQWFSAGTVKYMGSPAVQNDPLPMLVTKIISPTVVNGQVFLDGSYSLWVTNVPFETVDLLGNVPTGTDNRGRWSYLSRI